MSREEEVKEARLFDVRIVERNIKRGIITRKEYERFLKSLGDAAEKAAPTEPDSGAAHETPSSQG
jgi:hypothetical protein